MEELKNFKFGEEEKREVAKRLYERKLISEILKANLKVCPYYGIALYKKRRLREALKFLKACPDKLSRLYLNRIYLRKNEISKVYSSCLEDKSFCLDAGLFYFFKGLLPLSELFLEKARESFRKNFYLGLISYIRGDYSKAITYLSRAKKLSKGKEELSRVSFFLAKAKANLGKDFKNELLDSSRGKGFYALISSLLLFKNYLKVEKVEAKLKETTLNWKEIYDFSPFYFRLEVLKRKDRLSYGDYAQIVKLDPYIGAKVSPFLEFKYPRPYKIWVKLASARFKVEEELIYAVMRQESFFDPYAVSSSKALGLMQLLKETADWVSKRFKIPYKNLFNPKENIILGTAYLSYLLKLWKGNKILAIASYNAGPNRVKNWKRYEDEFLFIETIPINETRRYVRKVLENYYIYKSLP